MSYGVVWEPHRLGWLPTCPTSVKYWIDHVVYTKELGDPAPCINIQGKAYDAFDTNNTKKQIHMGSFSVATEKSTKHSKRTQNQCYISGALHVTYSSEFRPRNSYPKALTGEPWQQQCEVMI